MKRYTSARRLRTLMVAMALCGLGGILLLEPNGLLQAPGIASAAEADAAPTKQPDPGDPAKEAPAQSEESKNGEDSPPGDEPDNPDADASEEIFVPSEDISEDIDVPFPVDI